MAKVVGYINLHSDVSYKGLTEKRPVASVSFLGRYGIIDFVYQICQILMWIQWVFLLKKNQDHCLNI